MIGWVSALIYLLGPAALGAAMWRLTPPARRLHVAAGDAGEFWDGPGMHSNIVTTDPTGYAQRVFAFLEKSLGPPPRFRPTTHPSTVAGGLTSSHSPSDRPPAGRR